MIVKVRLFANLRPLLPEGSNGQEAELDVPEGSTPQVIITRLNIPLELAHLVMINGFHLLRDEVQNRVLQPGDVLSIFPPIAGG